MNQLVDGFCIICHRTRKLKNVTDLLNTKKKGTCADMIYKCFFIQFLDTHYGKINKICKNCITNLKFCCDFRLKVEVAHQKLYRIVDMQPIVKQTSNPFIDVKIEYKDRTKENYLNQMEKPIEKEIKNENDGGSPNIKYDDTYTFDDNNEINNYDSSKSDSEWSTNTDTVLFATGYWEEMKKIKSRLPYKPPTLSEDCNQCPLCEEHIQDKVKLQEHYNKHNLSLLLCDICGQLFSKKFAFDGHMSKHNNETFPCPDCDRVYFSKSGLLFHVKHVHLKMDPYACRKCRMTFSGWTQKHRHMIDTHGYSEEYSCDQCGKIFKRKNKLNDHIRRFHLKEKNCVCNYCSARFFSKVELMKHVVKHTGVKDQHCQYCGKAFGHRQYLKEHLKIHLNIKKFKCDICGKAFVQKCSLLGHMRTNHKV